MRAATLAPAVSVTAFELSHRYLGLRERSADGKDHPFIQWCFSLCVGWGLDTPDEVPWCAAFMQHAPWELNLPRSKSAAARSWLKVGRPIRMEDAVPGFDVVVLKRGGGNQPGPEVIAAPGHVGFFAGHHKPGLPVDARVLLLGGNQSNAVTIAPFRYEDVIGVRRLLD